VGKSSLMSMITRGTEAEITVVCLVGERGREVREFLERDLGPDGLERAVVVIATSDQPPLVRLRACFVATRIAEYFRDAGQNVLLLMDSLTRAAMAQREVGLSAGEPPATRGYPPSTFAMLPKLLERAGPGRDGSITGLYTVLVDGDDHNEPVADAARSILDGHVVLDRKLATSGHFPSIDVLESISRVAGAVTSPAQRAAASELRRIMAAGRDIRELVEIGAYVPGTNPDADRGLALKPRIDAFLRQSMDDQPNDRRRCLMTKFRLAGVLRARQAQETVAKANAAKARAAAEVAAAEVHRQAATLDSAHEVHPRTASALSVALSARQAMAAALSVAVGAAVEADVEVGTKVDELAVAASQRRAMDKLAERHAVTVRRAEEEVERRELDDLVGARFAATAEGTG
jgi:flagellar export protein FliJ